ncbi:MAG: beta-ketoacyl-[acyl-carrier-protein] synthase family protein [Candidatus Omnitrophica bacterium]|nr:beta-ketoacyl-[acyl-carrier-protein] synthase family protein [Candidatus Omnitrophota bacterium]
MRRAVITGIGIISPLGIGHENYWQNLIAGKSGVTEISFFDTSDYPSKMAAEIKEFEPTKFINNHRSSAMDRSTQLTVSAAKLAQKDSQFIINKENAEHVHVMMGTALGGLSWVLDQQMNLFKKGLNSIHKFTAAIGLANANSGEVSVELGAKGPSETFSVACSSVYSALAYALRKIRTNDVEVVFVGGGDAPLCPLPYATLSALGILSQKNSDPAGACRPFSNDRDGMVLGEGAAVFVVEEYAHAVKRKAKIYSEVSGVSTTCEAHNMLHHERNAEQASRAIKAALKDAKMNIKDITYINAHGLGGVTADIFEAMAIKKIFDNKKMKTTSIKASVGHALAGGGAIQLATSMLSIKHNIIPPVINFSVIDPKCNNLSVVTKPEEGKVNAILNNSFAFHGKDSVAILQKIK